MIKNKLILGSFVMYSMMAVSCTDVSPKMTNDYKPVNPDNSETQQLDYGELCAFPGAQGHGRNTTGGRGGQVYHVTSLADDGSVGTLRWALEQNGTRTIVFDVAGTIHLKSTLNTKYANLTIAGQTSPGGICIADYPFVINSDNVIVRFLRFRLGIKSQEYSSNEKAIDADALGGSDKKNVIVDHCSVSWSTDECLSVYGMQNSTVQWCMAYQALRKTSAKDDDQAHGYGGNWGGHYASYHHNIIAHCESRVPRLGPRYTTLAIGEYVDIRNNVYYNWNGEGCYGGEAQNTNIVNNYYKPGPATSEDRKTRIAKVGVYSSTYDNGDGYEPYKLIWGKFYINGNTVEGNESVSEDNWTDGVWEQMTQEGGVPDEVWNKRNEIYSAEPVVEAGHVTTSSATDAYDKVLEYAGACNYRDAIDELVINDIKNGTATCTTSGNPDGYINDPQDVLQGLSGYTDPFEVLTTDTSIDITDTDGDGIPDYWEKEHGLDYQYSSDGNMKTLDVNGKYTNVEMYLNSLVKTIMDRCMEGSIVE